MQQSRAEATLTDKIYLGVEYKLIFDLGAGQKVQVRSRDMRGIEDLEIGERATLTWDTSDVVLLRSKQSESV